MARQSFTNPIPFLLEAGEAATRYFTLERARMILSTEKWSQDRIRKVSRGLAAVVSLHYMLLLVLFWGTVALHERGVSSLVLAWASLIVFGTLSAILAWSALHLRPESFKRTPSNEPTENIEST